MRAETEAVTAREARAQIRAGRLRRPTAGIAPGYVQANLVVVPQALAADFHLFCRRNPKPCPLLEVLEPGAYEPRQTAPGADLRTDVPGYRVYRDGRLAAEAEDVRPYWRDDLVAFLIGCSFSFEPALLEAGIPVAHWGSERSVAMFRTSLETEPAGPFRGPLVVSLRWIPETMVERAIEITAGFPYAHGAPVHVGDPAAIGIRDLARPDYGDPWPQPPGSVPVFWACGVTPQAVAVACRAPLMITHAPGRMFITDQRDEDLREGFCG